jgi:hypothetical protein
MQEHVKRMQEERIQLNDKITAIEKFIYSNDDFDNIPKNDQYLMIEQRVHMLSYLKVLDARLWSAHI